MGSTDGGASDGLWTSVRDEFRQGPVAFVSTLAGLAAAIVGGVAYAVGAFPMILILILWALTEIALVVVLVELLRRRRGTKTDLAWSPSNLRFSLESGSSSGDVYLKSVPRHAWLRATVFNAGDLPCEVVAYTVDFFELGHHPVWSEGWIHTNTERRLVEQVAPAACSLKPRSPGTLSVKVLVPPEKVAGAPNLEDAQTVRVHVSGLVLVRLAGRPDFWHKFELWGDAKVDR